MKVEERGLERYRWRGQVWVLKGHEGLGVAAGGWGEGEGRDADGSWSPCKTDGRQGDHREVSTSLLSLNNGGK